MDKIPLFLSDGEEHASLEQVTEFGDDIDAYISLKENLINAVFVICFDGNLPPESKRWSPDDISNFCFSHLEDNFVPDQKANKIIPEVPLRQSRSVVTEAPPNSPTLEEVAQNSSCLGLRNTFDSPSSSSALRVLEGNHSSEKIKVRTIKDVSPNEVNNNGRATCSRSTSTSYFDFDALETITKHPVLPSERKILDKLGAMFQGFQFIKPRVPAESDECFLRSSGGRTCTSGLSNAVRSSLSCGPKKIVSGKSNKQKKPLKVEIQSTKKDFARVGLNKNEFSILQVPDKFTKNRDSSIGRVENKMNGTLQVNHKYRSTPAKIMGHEPQPKCIKTIGSKKLWKADDTRFVKQDIKQQQHESVKAIMKAKKREKSVDAAIKLRKTVSKLLKPKARSSFCFGKQVFPLQGPQLRIPEYALDYRCLDDAKTVIRETEKLISRQIIPKSALYRSNPYLSKSLVFSMPEPSTEIKLCTQSTQKKNKRSKSKTKSKQASESKITKDKKMDGHDHDHGQL